MSLYGSWGSEHGLPVFRYTADQDHTDGAEWNPLTSPPTRRHWLLVGNRAISLRVANDGRFGLLDERYGHRWLTSPDPGTGISIIESKGERWGSAWDLKPDSIPVRSFGPTWCKIAAAQGDISLDRTLLCPEGEYPWILVRVSLTNKGAGDVDVSHREEWLVSPRFINVYSGPAERKEVAEKWISFEVEQQDHRIVAREIRSGTAADFDRAIPEGDPQGGNETITRHYPQVFGPAIDFVLEAIGDREAVVETVLASNGQPHPEISITSKIKLPAGQTRHLWFRVGAEDDSTIGAPDGLVANDMKALSARLPRARSNKASMAELEVPWHAAMLTGGLCKDEVIGGHTLNQSSAYLDPMGFNGAARDPLQHALPLVYIQPDMALSVLRNTSAWSTPNGELPYTIDGAKQPTPLNFRPSDQSLWALLLAAEYCAVTGDVDAFEGALAYHPVYDAGAVTLQENLRRQFRYFVDGVGTGDHGHVRMLNADWNDMAVVLSGVPREQMAISGESVLNTAMAATVLPLYAGLCERLGDNETADEARELGEQFRLCMVAEWNGRWFNRAYAPGKGTLGEQDCWLEVQPWALLCGAANPAQADALFTEIDRLLRAGSPLGARVRGPVAMMKDQSTGPGTGTDGGVWFSINMTLVWAMARFDRQVAWDEWQAMTLSNHTRHYPHIWSGTLSGPDCYNGVEATSPGDTWGNAIIAMQSNPVNNQHSHSQPLLAYLRLLGLEVTAQNRLKVTGGGSFSSPNLFVSEDGHGWLTSKGEVTIESPFGVVKGIGRLEW
jgi:hypothetical protein